ncbi:hypothetical protein JW933_06215 [candidate division FCPU426 bacterium]|nr:hypothetical protein [candidate division FCPU426 bacterium]
MFLIHRRTCVWLLGLWLTGFSPPCLGGQWTVAVDVPHDIQGHTATLLPSGKVLLAGGHDSKKNLYYKNWLYDPQTGSIQGTGSLALPRTEHTAVLLPGGKVFIAGGRGKKDAAQSHCELFNPGSGECRSITSMHYARARHTATLLPSGQVLIAGGGHPQTELYDPQNNLFTLNARLPGNPAGHSATLLPDGTVFILDACNRRAYCLDPGQKALRLLSRPQYKRQDHTATLLADGRVLIVGGHTTVELYDPAENAFVKHAVLSEVLAGHSATLLPDGNVLIAGGRARAALALVLVYQAQEGCFGEKGALQDARCYHTATLLPGGQVLLYGGGGQARAEIHQPRTGAFHAAGVMEQPRNRHTATLLPDGKVLVAGGFNGAYLQECEIYDPSQGRFFQTGDLAVSRHCHSATLLPDGQVFIAGGYGDSQYRGDAELYQPRSGDFMRVHPLKVKREKHTATLLQEYPNTQVLIAGGFNGRYLNSAEIYDVATRSFHRTGNMTEVREKHTATLLPDGTVLIAGGYNGREYIASAEIYHSRPGRFKASGRMLVPRRMHTATLLPSGKVLIAGGRNAGGLLASAELYDPQTGFSLTGGMHAARNGHAATLLPNGTVLISGGGGTEAEIYYPETGTFSMSAETVRKRREHTATLLASQEVLLLGGEDGFAFLNDAEKAACSEYDCTLPAALPRPRLQTGVSDAYPGMVFEIRGSDFRGAGGGEGKAGVQASANYPRLYLQYADSGGMGAYGPSGRLCDISGSLYPMDWTAADTILRFCMPNIPPGYWLLFVSTNGVRSDAKIILNKSSPNVPHVSMPTPVPTGTPAAGIPQTAGWTEEFNGPPGQQPHQWRDETDDPDFNADLAYSSRHGYAVVTRTADSSWGRVRSPIILCDVVQFNMLEVKTVEISPGVKWNVALRAADTDYYWDLTPGNTDTGVYTVDYQEKTRLQGVRAFYLQVNMEGEPGQYVILDYIKIYGFQKQVPIATP